MVRASVQKYGLDGSESDLEGQHITHNTHLCPSMSSRLNVHFSTLQTIFLTLWSLFCLALFPLCTSLFYSMNSAMRNTKCWTLKSHVLGINICVCVWQRQLFVSVHPCMCDRLHHEDQVLGVVIKWTVKSLWCCFPEKLQSSFHFERVSGDQCVDQCAFLSPLCVWVYVCVCVWVRTFVHACMFLLVCVVHLILHK